MTEATKESERIHRKKNMQDVFCAGFTKRQNIIKKIFDGSNVVYYLSVAELATAKR